MKAWIIHSKGVLEDLKLETNVEIPKPAKFQVRIKIHAVSLNPVDYKRCSFDESFGYPNIPGLDVSGVIDEVGTDVTHFSKGDVVYLHANLKNNGGFAEYLVSYEEFVVNTGINNPSHQQFLDLAALPTACWTAINAIEKLHLNKDIKTVLVSAGAGGVGGFTIQLLKNWSIENSQKLTILTTCSSHNFDFVKKLGADYAIDYHKEDVKKRVDEILLEIPNNTGLNAWIDCVGSETADIAIDCLDFNGVIVSVTRPPTKPLPFDKALTYSQVALGWHYGSKQKYKLVEFGTHALKLYLDGKLNPMVEKVISFDEIQKGLFDLRERHSRGKTVVKVI